MAQEALLGNASEKQRAIPAGNRQQPFLLEAGQIGNFLKDMEASGKAEGTLKKYRSNINRFFEFLGEEKLVHADSLPRWKEDMIKAGYAERSINSSIVAVNRLYDFLGCWEWQLFDWMELKQDATREMTRDQYHRLLREARKQDNNQLYLLIKLLACTELTPVELPLVTRSAIDKGVVTGKKRGGQENVPLPESLRNDLLAFAAVRGIRSGPVFGSVNGKCIDRTLVSKQIAALGEEAHLPAGVANPRNLRRLYLNTMEQFRQQAEVWIARSYQQLLDDEEQDHGWHVREGC